ncbi:hypothetical protein ACH5RR_007832 [Cinchona calisaya]|uniref:AT-hook motif nuclear-localized protein n=1 Tax=Cinchona calisaya TaxID=153742 RepID=A0ABD3ADJ8_9GENT
MDHNMNTGSSGDEASRGLGLPAQPRGDANGSRRQSINQQRGRAPVVGSSGDEASWVLGLPAQPRGGANRSRRQSITQQRGRAPVVGSSGDEASPILDLPAQPRGGANRSRRQSITQQRGRAPVVGSSGDEASPVLGLPAQPRGGANRSRRQSITQQRGRAPVVGSRLAPNYSVDVIEVDAGEGIGEKIQSYLQVRGRLPSRFQGHSCLAVILSAEGAINSPRIHVQGSGRLPVLYEGMYEIVRLSGSFFIPTNGPVQLSGSLTITFRAPNDGFFGGSVVGSLIAATPLQVAMLIFIHDE